MSMLPKINFKYLLTTMLGVALGGLLTFYWNDISQLSLGIGLSLLAFLVVIATIILFIIISKRLSRKYDQVFGRVSDQVQEAIQNPAQVSDTLKNISNEAKPILSLWALNNTLNKVVLVMATVLGGIIAIQANKLINTQNERISFQNNLIEADRRSSLIFLMSNILDKVDEEIKEQRLKFEKEPGYHPDSVKYKLSKPLVSRIVALSRAFRPYRMLDNDTLSNELVSPERGQLLIALMENNLDSLTQNTIVRDGDFSNAIVGRIDLIDANLRGADLRGADLRGADLIDADLIDADLIIANLIGANLIGTDLSGAIFIGANLSGTDLSGTDLSDADLIGADLRDADLIGADLSGALLIGADLRGTDLRGTDLRGADLRGADLIDAENITYEQLKNTYTLFECERMPLDIREKLENKKPCLFESPIGPNACR